MTESYFCEYCGCKQPCEEFVVPRTITVRGRTFSYNHKLVACTECREEIYVPKINDENVLARLNAYFGGQKKEVEE